MLEEEGEGEREAHIRVDLTGLPRPLLPQMSRQLVRLKLLLYSRSAEVLLIIVGTLAPAY